MPQIRTVNLSSPGSEERLADLFPTGIASLDMQHDIVCEHIRAAIAAANLADEADFKMKTEEAMTLLEEHFQMEEDLMQKMNYPGQEEHRIEHQRLMTEIADQVALEGEPSVLSALRLLDALIRDMSGEDQTFARWAQAHPAQAHPAQVH